MTSDEPPPQSGWRPGDEAAATSVLDQRFDANSLSALRTAAQACAAQAGMPAERATDVVIALRELAANAVRPARGLGRLGYGTRSARYIAVLTTTARPARMISPAESRRWLAPRARSRLVAGQAGGRSADLAL